MSEALKRLLTAKRRRERMPKVCDSCGQNPPDPPSRLCPGCQAYRDHVQ